MKIVGRIRNEIADTITQQQWESVGKGSEAIMRFQRVFEERLSKSVSFVKGEDVDLDSPSLAEFVKPAHKEVYAILFELLPPDTIISECMPKISSRSSLSECWDIISDTLCDLLEQNKKVQQVSITKQKYLKNRLIEFAKIVNSDSITESFNEYVDNMRQTESFVDTLMFDIIANWFCRDIYIIDGETRLPYLYHTLSAETNRLGIVLLWVNQNHYEIIGRMNEDDNTVQREFDSDDEFIEKIRLYVDDQEQALTTYPELDISEE